MSALEELLELLALERSEENLCRAYHPKGRKHRLFGGQIMAQALRAAAYTIEPDRPPHSLHGYFLRPGDPAIPALIDVERIRDGKSFSTRRVVVIQHGQAIFNMDVSFQIVESGFNHQLDMPEREVPIVEMVPEKLRQAPFLSWRHDHKRLLSDVPQQPEQDVWFKANGDAGDEPIVHQCLAVYESDNALLSTARLPHRGAVKRESMQVASLDHAMWFHRPFRADEWLLHVSDSPSASGGRGFNRGSIFAEDGRLVASVTQEGLIRKRGTTFSE